MEKPPFKLSIVIPAFNEEHRILKTLHSIVDFIKKIGISSEIIVVNDGSTDNTVKLIEKFKKETQNIKLINSTRNGGKGLAVKLGIDASMGQYILFTDADNSTPIEEFEKLFAEMKNSRANIAIGSRYLRGSNVKIAQPLYRILIGRIGNALIQLFLIEDIRDTQCGFKLFEHKTAKEIFSFQKVKRFGFDMEALVIAKNLGYKIAEVPVSWFNSTESRFRPLKDTLRTLLDLLLIKLNLWSGRYSRDK